MSRKAGSELIPKLAVVLWSGEIGGAEILNAALARRLRQLGADATMVFVASPEPLAARLSGTGVPHTSLGFGRGRDVLRHPRRYAAEISRMGPDGALLVQCGFMGAALRAGGYQGPIVAVAHGPLRDHPSFSRYRRLFRRLDRISGALADDAEVAVSDFVLDHMHRYPHSRRLLRIHNAIDPDGYSSEAVTPHGNPCDEGLVVGFMGRLVKGKGVDYLIRALAHARRRLRAKLLVAGDGPDRARLALLAGKLGVGTDVTFLGVIDDVDAFWHRCDIAVIPSAGLEEAFSMVTLEAMACGKPVIATARGAIPELVVDGNTGTLVGPGEVSALAEALVAYAQNSELRHAHGAAGRERAIERFHIDECARAYLDLFAELATRSSARGERRTADERQLR